MYFLMKKGIQLAILTTCISGFSIFASKIFLTNMDPVLFTTLKNLIVAIILSGIVLSSHKQKLFQLTLKQWKQLLFIGIIGGSIPFALFFIGLSKISALEGALIHKSLFIWVAIMGMFFLRERINRYQILGYIIVTAGALFLGVESYSDLSIGHIMVLIATFFWSVEYIIAKKILHTIPSSIVAWGRMFFGVIVLLGISAYQGLIPQIATLDSSQVLAIFSGAVFLIGYVLTWYAALSKSQASLVSLVLAASPIITGVLSSIFISHAFPQSNMLSWVIIIFGIVLTIVFGRLRHAST